MITAAQRAVAAELPFDLSDAEIERQINPDGSPRPFISASPMVRARQLAQAAMATVIATPVALAA